MIINIKLDYNPTTEECKVLKVEVENPKKVSNEPVKIMESNEPQITLDSSKYTLNAAAVELMQVTPNTRIDIKYQMVDEILYPIIGTEESFGTNGGNKLTKSNTISYRGKANQRLSEYGNVFTLVPLRGSEGLFVLMGNSQPEPQEVPDEIEVIEDVNDHVDLTDSDGDPLSFDDNFSEKLEDSELIDEDVLVFE